MSTKTEAGDCGDPDCEDGYVFYPPLQDGGLGVSRPCPACARLWQQWHSNAERRQ